MAIPKEFLREDKIRAIIMIKNLKTDEIYLYKTEDAVASFSKERFKLDLGMHPEKSLQSAYSTLGLELFIFEIDKEADKDQDLDKLLEERKAYWIGKGARLYS
ncbi:MAG: hypothetical protein MSS69_06525 [Spirochaetales bacterium]|nr:hypothetical protein [Spirochaetales bacterium]